MDKLLIKGGTPLYGTVSINGAKNAAIFVAEMFAISDKALAEKLVEYRKNMAEEVAKKAARVEQQLG